MVSDNTTRFKTWFKPPVELSKATNYEIALVNLETYYSFPNIEKPTVILDIPPMEDNGLIYLFRIVAIKLKILMSSFSKQISENNHKEAVTISANTNKLKAEMILKENYQVDFRPPNSISSILEFSKNYTSQSFKNLRTQSTFPILTLY